MIIFRLPAITALVAALIPGSGIRASRVDVRSHQESLTKAAQPSCAGHHMNACSMGRYAAERTQNAPLPHESPVTPGKSQ